MKARALIILTSLATCGLAVAGVAWQSRHLVKLRDDGRQLRQQLNELAVPPPTVTPTAPSSPSAELLSLRNQVSQLARRERELAGVQVENERLRTQVAVARTNAAQRPTGYIRKSEARYLGFTTPEATIETYLWAVRNRDLEAMLTCFTPEAAAEIKKEFERGGPGRPIEKLLENSEALPGINVLERIHQGDDAMEYRIEMVPGSGVNEPMPFRRIEGEWKFGPPRRGR
jgi:hypothetical protein